MSRDQLSTVVPGVLKSYDLPDLAASLAPRPLAIRAPVDSTGEPVPLATVEQIYARCAAGYSASGALELRDRQ